MTKGCQRGFLLVEVMFTVTLLAIGMTGILRGYITAVNALKVSKDVLNALYLTEEKVLDIEQELVENNGSLENLGYSSIFEGAYSNFSWELKVTPIDKQPLNEINVTVFNMNYKPAREFSLAAYVEAENEE